MLGAEKVKTFFHSKECSSFQLMDTKVNHFCTTSFDFAAPKYKYIIEFWSMI